MKKATVKRVVKVLGSVADVMVSAQWTPVGLASVAAKAASAWWDTEPEALDYIDGFARAEASPCWPLTLRRARQTAHVLASDAHSVAFEARIGKALIRWVEQDWGFIGPVVVEPALVDHCRYLWGKMRHAVLELRRPHERPNSEPVPVMCAERSDFDTGSEFSSMVVAELRKWLAVGEPRGEVFVGPSGSGKSVAARAVAAALGGRSLALRAGDLDQLLDIIEQLEPKVVILHDIHHDPPDPMTIERLRAIVPVVLATSTTEPDQEISRPGRFERVRHLQQVLPITYQAEYDRRCRVLGGTQEERDEWMEELTARAAVELSKEMVE